MTSKPSTTNCPKAFFSMAHAFNCMVLLYTDCLVNNVSNISGGYCGRVPPLPIPNREVKPACADGTAMQCGRVGSRLLSDRELQNDCSEALFCFPPEDRIVNNLERKGTGREDY